MKANYAKILVGGAMLVSGAWAVGMNIPPGAEPAPMETMLAADGEAVATASLAAPAVTWDLTPTRNDAVDTWIGFLAGRNADKTRLWMERSGRYTPMIREQLRARGMPEDLIYLAFIESGYTPRAYSKAAASGLWQFIAETGKRYGLEVNGYVDERRDPIESTEAALQYLSELHDRFGSWYLAAAAYNTGENRVARIMREQTGRERGRDSDFWLIADRLPRETRNYVPLMLAAGHIGKSPEEFGFDNVAYHQPLAFDTAWVTAQSSLNLVARAAGVEVDAVKDLNPHLVKAVTPPGKAYPVRIPRGSQLAFESNYATLYKAEREQEKQRVKLASATTKSTSRASRAKLHAVRRGENLTTIARRYNVSVVKLQRLNGLSWKSRIYPGQKLKIG